jgi:hypothetical protein
VLIQRWLQGLMRMVNRETLINNDLRSGTPAAFCSWPFHSNYRQLLTVDSCIL